jgi:hypothetical protein
LVVWVAEAFIPGPELGPLLEGGEEVLGRKPEAVRPAADLVAGECSG